MAQQSATDDILRTISQSPGELDVILDVILDHALRLCNAHLGSVFLYDGEGFVAKGLKGVPTAFKEFLLSGVLYPGPNTAIARNGETTPCNSCR